jgi:signal transduction histidine kinase
VWIHTGVEGYISLIAILNMRLEFNSGVEKPESPPEQATKLRRLHDVTRQMVQAESESALFRTVTEAATDLLGFEFNTVRRYDKTQELLVPAAVSPTLRETTGERQPYERGNTVQWRAFDENELLVFQHVAEIDDDVERSGDGSMMVVPLADYGVLTMGSPKPQVIGDHDRQLARVFAANIETAIERVERLETLRTREEELAEKNERLERFASKLSHELRNPLNVIAGRIDLARETGDKEHFEHLEQSIGRMNRLIDDLLSFTRNGAVELDSEWVEMSTVAADSWEAIRSPRATLQFDSAGEIHADRDRFQQLLDNLFRNSVEHALPSPESNGSDRGELTVTVGTVADGFFVEDDGCGIPSDERDRLRGEGETALPHWTGLGLRIVSEVAEAHGWSMRIGESDSGGARFEFHVVDTRPS